MMKKFNGKPPERKPSERVNEHIRISPVMVIDPDGRNLGAIPTDRARQMAQACGLDLVEVAPQARPPVCRIMDYGKYKFEKGRKQKEQQSRQRQQPDMKGMWFSSTIGENDFQVKLGKIKEFLDQGHKVQVEVRFRNRAIVHTNVGFDLIRRMSEALKEHATLSEQPKMDHKRAKCMFSPIVKT